MRCLKNAYFWRSKKSTKIDPGQAPEASQASKSSQSSQWTNHRCREHHGGSQFSMFDIIFCRHMRCLKNHNFWWEKRSTKIDPGQASEAPRLQNAHSDHQEPATDAQGNVWGSQFRFSTEFVGVRSWCLTCFEGSHAELSLRVIPRGDIGWRSAAGSKFGIEKSS